MTTSQQTAYYRGFDDRSAGQPMADSFSLTPETANAYLNGYVAACYAADDGKGREGWHE